MVATPAHSPENSRITQNFADLPPEIRNAIYALVFDSPSLLFVVAAQGPRPRFKLRERSEESHYYAVSALRTLEMVSRAIRQEARTFFYATKQFIILPYGYEYLPIFVQWLDSIGPQCRPVLRNVYFAGFMWYQGSDSLTQQFHDLLRSCTGLRRLGVQINICHLCEACNQILDAHLKIDGPDPQNSPMPEVDMSAWAETIVMLPELESFRLDLILSVDKMKEAFGEVSEYMAFTKGRGVLLALDVERRLREAMVGLGTGSGVELEVGYIGTNRRQYYGAPWWEPNSTL